MRKKDSNSVPTLEQSADLVLALERKFFEMGGSGQILDCGCGEGKWMERLSSNDKVRLIGLDISTLGLKHAKKFGTVIRGSGESLPFKQESFDAVMAYSVLHHISNPEKVLNQIHNVLKKDGLLLLIETLEDNPFIKIGRFFYPYFNRMPVLSKFNLNKLRRLMVHSKFKVLYSFTSGFFWVVFFLIKPIIFKFSNFKTPFMALVRNIDKNRIFSRFYGHYYGLFVKI